MYLSTGWPATVLLPIIFWKVPLELEKLLYGAPSLKFFVESLRAISRHLPSILCPELILEPSVASLLMLMLPWIFLTVHLPGSDASPSTILCIPPLRRCRVDAYAMIGSVVGASPWIPAWIQGYVLPSAYPEYDPHHLYVPAFLTLNFLSFVLLWLFSQYPSGRMGERIEQ